MKKWKSIILVLMIIFCGGVYTPKLKGFQVLPFKLKKKPAKKEEKSKNPLEEMKFVNKKEKIFLNKLSVNSGFHSGYYFLFGFPKNRDDFWIPYVSLYTQISIIEFELSYLGLQGQDKIRPKERAIHEIPLIISLVGKIKLSQSIDLYPKIGGGSMLILTHANYMKTNYSSLAVVKPSLQLGFKVSNKFSINLYNSLLVAQDSHEKIGEKIHFYYIPSLGFSSRF